MTFVQLGCGLTKKEITIRLIASFAERLTAPVHFVPEIAILPPAADWPLRGVLHA